VTVVDQEAIDAANTAPTTEAAAPTSEPVAGAAPLPTAPAPTN